LQLDQIPVSGTVSGWSIKTINNGNTYGGGVTGSSGGGGGGGGGGGKKQKHDKVEARGNRYHEVTENLSRISENLEEIDKAKKRAYGKNHLKNLEKENELLKK
jgi:hypothetical protein